MSFRRQSMLLVLLTLFLRLPAVLHPKYIDDEGGYAVVAHELLHGGTLYISALDRKPPLLFWIYTAIFFVVGHYNWVALHLIAVGWILLTMWGLYALGKELFHREVGLVAALLYSIYTASVHYHLLAFNGEVMMNLPIVWALYVLLPAYRAQRHLRLRHSVVHATLLTASYFLTLGLVVLVLHTQGILRDAYYWT